ncbi:MAG TPA: hypothetical protein VLS45_07680, partial [Methylomicrobium sp.]|nr:hypothetical protein [Methylomicrobium sp.]
RIEPFGRINWTDPIVLYEDAANEAVDGYLVLDQGFEDQDDNGHRVVGRARVRVRVQSSGDRSSAVPQFAVPRTVYLIPVPAGETEEKNHA